MAQCGTAQRTRQQCSIGGCERFHHNLSTSTFKKITQLLSMSFSFQWCKGPGTSGYTNDHKCMVLFLVVYPREAPMDGNLLPSFGVKLDPALRADMVLQCYMIYDFQVWGLWTVWSSWISRNPCVAWGHQHQHHRTPTMWTLWVKCPSRRWQRSSVEIQRRRRLQAEPGNPHGIMSLSLPRWPHYARVWS